MFIDRFLAQAESVLKTFNFLNPVQTLHSELPKDLKKADRILRGTKSGKSGLYDVHNKSKDSNRRVDLSDIEYKFAKHGVDLGYEQLQTLIDAYKNKVNNLMFIPNRTNQLPIIKEYEQLISDLNDLSIKKATEDSHELDSALDQHKTEMAKTLMELGSPISEDSLELVIKTDDSDLVEELLTKHSKELGRGDYKKAEGLIRRKKTDKKVKALVQKAHLKYESDRLREQYDTWKANGYGTLQIITFLDEPEALKKYLNEATDIGDVDAIDASGRTALHEAALRENSESMELLIKAGADPRVKSDRNVTIFDIMIKNNDVICLTKVLSLLPEGPDKQSLVRSSLIAVMPYKKGREALIDTLFDALDKQTFSMTDKRGNDLLHTASKYGNAYAVGRLLDISEDDPSLKAHINLNKVNTFGQTALHCAAASGDASTIKRVLKHNLHKTSDRKVKAKILEMRLFATDNKGKTPLDIVAKTEKEDAIQAMLSFRPKKP